MNRIELSALRSTALLWDKLVEELPPALESLGLAHDDKATDGSARVHDYGEDGCVIFFENIALARRAARALAVRCELPVEVFEVSGSAGNERFRFRTTAWKATPAGGLLEAEGVELDLEDPEENWGGGTLEVQANQVLDLFADLNRRGSRILELGYRRRPKGRPSSPRIAKLMQTLQKAKSIEAQPQPDGRVALMIELATGGKQTSFCSAAEHEEVERLIGGR